MKHIIASLFFATVMGIMALAIVIAGAPRAVAHEGMGTPAAVAAAPKPSSRAAARTEIPKDTYKSRTETSPDKIRVITPSVVSIPAKSVNCRRTPCRRTLFVPVGQKKLALEAPMNMCFLDQTSYEQSLFYGALSDVIGKKGGQTLLAVFMNCNDTVNMKNWSGSGGLPPNVGIVTWMNPSIGETTPLSRHDYLDMREASFLQYAENNADGLLVDKKVRRTENGVSLGMTGTTGASYERLKSTAILATTALQHIPIEITLRYTGTTPPHLDKLYPLMDKFVEQQVALNP